MGTYLPGPRAAVREKTVAANLERWGAGALNIDDCRVGDDGGSRTIVGTNDNKTVHAFGDGLGARGGSIARPAGLGRWPANIVHDGSPEVVAMFPDTAAAKATDRGDRPAMIEGGRLSPDGGVRGHDDNGGSAARFFYSAKADADDRLGSKHPTVKPVDLMQWLCRLITPKGGLILDPFSGTGTTGAAAYREGFRAVLIEREAEYQADIARRMKLELAGPDERARGAIKAKLADKPTDSGPLFAMLANDNTPLPVAS